MSSRDENITFDVQTPTFSTPESLFYNITGLSAGSEYAVRVAASTVNGTGPFTREMRIRTLDDGECMFNGTSARNLRISIVLSAYNVLHLFVSSWTSQKFDF